MQSGVAFSTVASQQEGWESNPQLQQSCVELVCALRVLVGFLLGPP